MGRRLSRARSVASRPLHRGAQRASTQATSAHFAPPAQAPPLASDKPGRRARSSSVRHCLSDMGRPADTRPAGARDLRSCGFSGRFFAASENHAEGGAATQPAPATSPTRSTMRGALDTHRPRLHSRRSEHARVAVSHARLGRWAGAHVQTAASRRMEQSASTSPTVASVLVWTTCSCDRTRIRACAIADASERDPIGGRRARSSSGASASPAVAWALALGRERARGALPSA